MKQKWSRRGFLGGFLGSSAIALTPKRGAAKTANPPDSAEQPLTEVLDSCAVSMMINGKHCAVEVAAGAPALDVIRGQLELRGAKRGCAQGVCGACTVHIDGQASLSCVLPAAMLHERAVTTVENWTELHPVQRALMAKDGLQCGFCTPGFVMAAIPFVDQWRAQHGDKVPRRTEIAEALAGNLCRCGAYDGIFEGIQAACTGAFDQTDDIAPPRTDAEVKVRGAAVYTADVQLPGMLHVAMLRSSVGHGRVLSVELDAALKSSGVHGAYRFIRPGSTIRFWGQELVAVAAESYDLARQALDKIVVAVEERPVVASIDAALDTNAPLIYAKDQRKEASSAAEGPTFLGKWSGNLRGPMSMSIFTKPRRAVKIVQQSERDDELLLHRQRYQTHVQAHCSMEPHGCVAHWSDEGLKVWLSTQAVKIVADDIAERWELPKEKVQLFAEFVGGGFGSKAGAQPELLTAVELSRQTGRPVKYILRREEELIVGGIRPSTRVNAALCDRSGKLEAIQLQGYSDSGVAIGSSVATVPNILYPGVPKQIQDWDVVTNGPAGMAFRGPGGPAGLWALEQAIDALAVRRGVDPLEYRTANDSDPVRQRLFAWVAQQDLWKLRSTVPRREGEWLIGVGMATSAWMYILNPQSLVRLATTSAGGIVLSSASQDMGNGTKAALCWAVAEELGMDRSRVEVRLGDSHFPRGAGSYGSQTTASMVPAARDAVQELKTLLLEEAESLLGWKDSKDAGQTVRHAQGTASWQELLDRVEPVELVGRRRKDKGGYKISLGPFALGKAQPAAVQLYEVAVHRYTGKVKVLRGSMALSAGKIVSPPVAESQVKGGMIQGISYALYEHRKLDPDSAFPLSTDLNEYHLMGAADAPEMEVTFDETPLGPDPKQSCGLSEMATVASAAAIGNAIFNAIGQQLTHLPIDALQVLTALDQTEETG